ncbi:MAG: RES family NAD+ phosphorylase [Sphingobacteriales bacterium]|nr:RES family NAD+ phosphorylase [Sphingobacteriales bacterium]
MELYRITQVKYADDLTGNGARLYGGRWNSEGLFAVYTSSSRALALLEVLAHTPAKMLDEKDYMLVTLSIPDSVKKDEIVLADLTTGWDAPDTRPITKRLGDKFLRSKSGLLLAVPSVLVPEEMNYVLNPLHNDMRKVKLAQRRRIAFDRRVTKTL